ncbi:WecB/TagA/CpsF family glycosyltransferase, partial [Patescibacteria group bacterium]|nr:WecB/TagA/CpsF family glycosyltransferase [Patescibacteria group bacterium]
MNHELFGISIDDISENELDSTLNAFLNGDETRTIATPNPEMILDALSDDDLKSALLNSDLCLPDGVALRFAVSAMADARLKNRHTGVDTLQSLSQICARSNKKILFFGAEPGVLCSA